MRMTPALSPVALLAVLCAGCFGDPIPPSSSDAGYGTLPDLRPACVADNDGVIARGELAFSLDVPIRYLSNPPGTTVAVAPRGSEGPSGLEWDLTSTAGDVQSLVLEPVSRFWFASSFPTGDYVTTTDLASGTLGVFRITESALEILGYASRAEGRTLLVYDRPVQSLRFPVKEGDAWVSSARVTGGTLEGQPFASMDTYRVEVAARGTAVLPYLKVQNTLRIEVQLSQALPGGVAITRVQQLFFRECFGELGRMVSPPGVSDPAFGTAAEFRRLAL